MRQLCRLTWRWIPCRSLGRWCGSLCFFWAPLRHERCVGTCWDMKWFETLSKHVQTIALAVLESWTSGPSYVLQNVIKAYQSISRNITYIYIYIHNYIRVEGGYSSVHRRWSPIDFDIFDMFPFCSGKMWNSPGVWTFLDRIRGGFTIGSPPFLSSRRGPQMQSHSHGCHGQLGISRSSCGSLAQFRVGICFLHSWVTSSSVVYWE